MREKTTTSDLAPRSAADRKGRAAASAPRRGADGLTGRAKRLAALAELANGSTSEPGVVTQLRRTPLESETKPFPKLVGKSVGDLGALYDKCLAAGSTMLDKLIAQDAPPAQAAPKGKFAGNWTVEKSNAGRGRVQYEIKHNDAKLKNEGQSLHYKNVLVVREGEPVTVEALSNYGPTKKMRDDGVPGCGTFLSDAWQFMLDDYAETKGHAVRIQQFVRSNIENADTLATIFLCSDYAAGNFNVTSSAMDRIALLGSPNGIGFMQMLSNRPDSVDLAASIHAGRFLIQIRVYGVAAPNLKADMVIG